jgi:sulfatase-like protein
MRDQIFANQKRLGVIPTNAQLTEWPADLPKWETLSADEKKLFARQAEVYAGYTAYTDYEIGRVIQAVEDMGKLDNTLIIYIDGDNGTSPEGTLLGTPNQYTAYNGILKIPVEEQLKYRERQRRVERSGSTLPHGRAAYSPAALPAWAGRERCNLFRCHRTLDTRQYAPWKHQSCALARGSREQEGANARVRSGRRSTLKVEPSGWRA